MTKDKATEFLNVDVQLRSKQNLRILGNFLAKSCFMLQKKKDFLAFEVNFDLKTAEETVRAIVEMIEALPPPEREIWDSCESRCFDIGISAADTPPVAEFELSREAVRLLADVGAEIRITVYAPSTAD